MTAKTTSGVPRGIRNSNPLNLRKTSDKWQGLSPIQGDDSFFCFVDAHHGIRAGTKVLLTYYRKHKLRTAQSIIGRWAPPEDDNDTGAYISSVTASLGVFADTQLDLENQQIMESLVAAMIKVECGGNFYDAETISLAVNSAYGSGPSDPPPVAVVISPPVVTDPTKPPLVDQPSPLPSRKIIAGGLGGAIAFIVMILWNKVLPDSPMEPEYAIALANAAILLPAYLTRDRANVPVETQP